MTSSSGDPSSSELANLRRERDLYLRLLQLGHSNAIDAFLQDALALFVDLAQAERGYLEISDEALGPDSFFWIARGCSDEEITEIRSTFSRGVIAEALATGQTIATASALADPRFKDRKSVRRHRIEAVLCAPIGTAPPLGVLYLQGRAEPGPFPEEDRERAETFARHVLPFVDRLLLRHRRTTENDPTRAVRKAFACSSIVGRSEALARVLKQAAIAAPLDVTVLLLGPSGTGKTQLARALHDNSPRASRPFVEVNCAGLPEPLLESELFGAMPGAHSSATRRIEGKVAAADRGTLFLDEVGELTLSAQAKLLQLLQSREYYPLGASRAARADVRILAATNIDLRAAVDRRAFREDLYYRLHVLPIVLPSLAERREDVADLAAAFCARAVEEHRLPQMRLSPGALRALELADWPGNVRQLANAVEVTAIQAAGEGLLEIEPKHLFGGAAAGRATQGSPSEGIASFQEETRRFQKELLQKVLTGASWNVTEASRRLDLTRQHLYNLVRSFHLERPRP